MNSLIEMLTYLLNHYMENSRSINELKALFIQLAHVQHEIEQLQAEKDSLEIAATTSEIPIEPVSQVKKKQYLWQQIADPDSQAFRIYSQEECSRLSIECRGLLHDLEKTGILTPAERESALLKIMLAENKSFELDEFKHILCMLFEEKFSLIENLWVRNWPIKELPDRHH